MHGGKRDVWLDALRGVAVLLVLGRHFELPPDAGPLLTAWQRGGWVGVDLFFVLSGFLVSGVLFREYRRRRALSLPRFLARRGLRIYPAFGVLLLCTWLLAPIFHTPRTSGRRFLAELLFVQNYAAGVWNHTWSLAVEEHFYLALPIVLLSLAWIGRQRRDPYRPLLFLAAAVVPGVAALRCVNAWWYPYTNPTHLFPTHLRADALLAGVLLAYVYHYQPARYHRFVAGRRRFLALAGAMCFIPAFVFELPGSWFVPTLGLTLFALGGVLLIASGVGATARAPVTVLALIGSASYSIYLWHMPVLLWGVPLCETALGYQLEDSTRIALYLAASLAVGMAMVRLTEQPILWLRERWLPRQHRSGPSPSAGEGQREPRVALGLGRDASPFEAGRVH
jgi:peptidoglycan/LPS O-acetylase OafA/YrhL